jgi:hypothetical protein
MVALRYVAGCAETQESIVLDQEIVASQVKADRFPSRASDTSR